MTDKKTIRVRIAVAVNPNGTAIGCGFERKGFNPKATPESLLSDWDMISNVESGAAFCWIEADAPAPNPGEVPVIEGKVQP